MDKVKQEIEKILEELTHKHCQNCNGNNEPYIPSQDEKNIDQATSSITALIIKWLESKRGKLVALTDALDKETFRRAGRNRLLTELVEELK